LWFAEFAAVKIGRITTAGTITEFSTPYTGINGSGALRPAGITVGPDGALWFPESSNVIGKIGRMTTAGALTEFAISAPAHGITTGPDGALWFTQTNSNTIVRMTTLGQTTELALPTSPAGPGEITLGPDGALWFTEVYANRVGTIR
jgi:virginiamycin B lyase